MVPESMNAAVALRYGAPDVLRLCRVPRPDPGPGQVLVRVKAIGLNFADIIGRWGKYPGTPKPPFIPGIEFSGEVVARGEAADLHPIGGRVMGYSRIGSHAEFVAVNQQMVGRIPDGIAFDTAAAFPVAAMTAFHGLRMLAGLARGERVLIHAAAGGVGTAAVQFAKHLGAEVFATAGTDEKTEVARQQGADHVVNYRDNDFARFVLERTRHEGVDVVFDSVGGPVFRRSWSLLRGMGRYVLFGLSSVSGTGGLNIARALRVYAQMGFVLPASLLSSNRALFGFNIGTLEGKERYLADAAGELIGLLTSGVFRPVIGKRFPLDQIVAAHTELQTGRSIGKVIVLTGEDR